MKRWTPRLLVALGALMLAARLLPPRNPGAFDLQGFGRLPVLANGRIKPMDTVARSSLLLLQGNQALNAPDGNSPLRAADGHLLTPMDWLLDVFFRQDAADAYAVFTINNLDLLALIGKNESSLRIHYDKAADQLGAVLGMRNVHYTQFSYREIEPYAAKIEEQAKLAQPIEEQARTPFQRAVVQLYGNVLLYRSLENALVAPGSDDFLSELTRFQKAVPAGVAAVRAQEAGRPHDEDLAQATLDLGRRYLAMSQASRILAVPPAPGADPNAWTSTGKALLETFRSGEVDPACLTYAGLGLTWRRQQAEQFNQIVSLYSAELGRRFPSAVSKCATEVRFNAASPFVSSMVLYVFGFLLAVGSWLKWPDALGRAAFGLVGLAWLAATAGILTRMGLEGRPPVTNLYSSALFVGWGAVGLCLVLEWLYRNGIGSVAAGLIGFGTLLIAHYLSLGGDTLEMMQAVLDSNFWLATHVVVVATGYASTFLAGFLALIYVVRGLFTRSLDRQTADALGRMVYGIVCFATLFSFVGTVLGGIWADQSWGRFWGWDPKENGALIIVLWNALILHARWGGLVRQRGLMCLALFGNIVTSWSWFGTNLLGVGLHSYGFTKSGFWWLLIFVSSQLALIAAASLPLKKWRSFRSE